MAETLRYAALHVSRTERITPLMQRVTFGGEDLADFQHVSPDQHSKLFFSRLPGRAPVVPPMPADGDVGRWYLDYLAMPELERPWMRSYTIRSHDPVRQEIDIDFVLHGEGDHSGPAAQWAAHAEPGDVVGMYGPQISHYRTPGPRDWTLLAGDETALPAIGALLEALAPGERAIAFVEVDGAAEEQEFTTAGDVTLHWLHREGTPAGHSPVLVDAVRAAGFPDGEVFAWVAGESSAVRALRRHLVNDRGIDKRAVAFTGYWRLKLTQDDALTTDDLADRAEALAEAAPAVEQS
ncbi:siderophore-interacting protein [Streptomyces albipurpureus]|uniref:Siderophore-interacting protein n=1 Tax=Streptomyces albipurpureus TaxID=2897419 RepID=A0ABT0UGM4_9ACTN|nr:siderophore-interacting protein [Streptomyces sp. CWNU-1]MCM2387347.1 siderophore-interacting protein [Streptomyces sp. CWNU-1]